MQNSCYEQARDLANKVDSIGCVAVPFSSDAAASRLTELTEGQIEQVAQLEHQRWVSERVAAGWTYAPIKDIEAKKSPFIVDFESLPSDIKELDYDHAREMIALHESAGYAIVPKSALCDPSRALVEKLEDAEYAADHDPLTGALNLRGGRKVACAAFQAFKLGEAFSIVVFDIDKFKHFNDSYGHSKGDEVLKAVVEAMRGVNDGKAHIIRQGGDEFSLVVEGIGEEDATELAKQLEGASRGIAVEYNRETIPIGISAGIDWFRADDADSPGAEWGEAQGAVNRADEKLYRAKAKEGGVVVF